MTNYRSGQHVWLRARFGREWFTGVVQLVIDDKHCVVQYLVNDLDAGTRYRASRTFHVRRMRALRPALPVPQEGLSE